VPVERIPISDEDRNERLEFDESEGCMRCENTRRMDSGISSGSQLRCSIRLYRRKEEEEEKEPAEQRSSTHTSPLAIVSSTNSVLNKLRGTSAKSRRRVRSISNTPPLLTPRLSKGPNAKNKIQDNHYRIPVDLIKNLCSENPVGKTAAIRKKSADTNNTKVRSNQIKYQTEIKFKKHN